jgi:hypothetical protein
MGASRSEQVSGLLGVQGEERDVIGAHSVTRRGILHP